jgi:hypothetical protein
LAAAASEVAKMKRTLANLDHYKYWYLAVILLIAGGVQFLIPSHPSRITRLDLYTIKNGMTQAEVEEILGPGADQTAHPERTGHGRVGFSMGFAKQPEVWKYWDGDEGTIAVEFADEKALYKEWRPAISLWDRLKDELPW